MKILLAVDGSDYSRRAIAYLGAHKQMWVVGHELTVLYVVLPLPHRAAAFGTPEMVHAFYEDDAGSVLRPIEALLRTEGLTAKIVHKIGHPAEVISACAQDQAFDLVVMGSNGAGALQKLVLGSVTTKVLAKCPTPVLLVH